MNDRNEIILYIGECITKEGRKPYKSAFLLYAKPKVITLFINLLTIGS